MARDTYSYNIVISTIKWSFSISNKNMIIRCITWIPIQTVNFLINVKYKLSKFRSTKCSFMCNLSGKCQTLIEDKFDSLRCYFCISPDDYHSKIKLQYRMIETCSDSITWRIHTISILDLPTLHVKTEHFPVI